jgi:DNA-binding protein HU-beta
MNYKELIERLSRQTGQSQTKTRKLLGDAVSVFTDQLSEGKSVSIPNLGTFSTKDSDEKKVYNPHHDAYLLVPPKRVVDFSPSSILKEEVKFLEPDNE